MTITIDKHGCKKATGKHVRLVYTEKQHITTIDGTTKSKTWTKQEVEEFTTVKQSENRAKKLGLETSEHNKERHG